MPRLITYISAIILTALFLLCGKKSDVWGFYAHKLINQKAIFLLPTELIPIFKLNLEDVRHFAIAPDQRRHSSPHEAVRHYMDLDHWGVLPFSNVPRSYSSAVWKFGNIYFVNEEASDTMFVKKKTSLLNSGLRDSLMSFFYENVRYDEQKAKEWDLSEMESKTHFLPFQELENYNKLYFHNRLDEYGIIPYHLTSYQNRLMWAFVDNDISSIIRLAGEMGHYISDAHVPLHTTENYNGQLTGQDGIHAFWETRIPELFAAENYDFWTEPRAYIENKEDYFWNIVLESHDLVDDVLNLEMDLRKSFPKDNQYCFDERLGVTQRIECVAYAKAYQKSMNGMVENRMREAITAIASSWYTAWIDAGSPIITPLKVNFQVEKEHTDVQMDSLKVRIEN
tara:strand:+ start:760 stop:1944 length:1185 start_codon:yes stop_codon:yes gene_type:complete